VKIRHRQWRIHVAALVVALISLLGVTVAAANACLQVNKVTDQKTTIEHCSNVTVTSNDGKEKTCGNQVFNFSRGLTCGGYFLSRVWDAAGTSLGALQLGERGTMATKIVKDTAGLLAAVKAAKSGDVILLESGTYSAVKLNGLSLTNVTCR
jgi:hypothetical protein